LLNTNDAQDGTTGAELHVRSNSHFDRRADSFAIYKRPKAGVRVAHRTAAVAEAELSVLARNHRPLVLGKEVMADCGVATHQHNIAGEGALTVDLAAAIFCEN
jgi:hypothetical protein